MRLPMRFAPANIQLRRAQLTLMLATLLPTVLMTATGIVLIVVGGSLAIIFGILVLVFCTTAITGYILGSIFVSRGASMARVQNDFLSSVSHELRTPLTSIRIFMETLRDGRLTDLEEQQKCFDLLGQEVNRLEGLVERLLELSRIEAGSQIFERVPVPVEDIIKDALGTFDAATLRNPTKVTVDLEADLVIEGDRKALATAVFNLLHNAWKYTPADDKQIRVSARALDDRQAEILVADNGMGIARSEKRRIFEKFERGKRAVDGRTEGVGLGLSTVDAIARALRGRVELVTTGPKGSLFRIVLRRKPNT